MSPSNQTSSGGCPVDHSRLAQGGGECPVKNKDGSFGILNPQNMMPHLGNSMAPGQDKPLPTERTASIIPKADETGKTWAYPSPQQFYNALNRKGWETPVDAVPMMVDIHNFLNDACWEEIMKWEREYHCDCKDVKLARFMGRPHDLSPKARIYGFFGAEKPFDRHDWVVDRCGKEVRYVIDYYGGYPEGDNPVFHVDVRPALDSPSAFFDRSRKTFAETWQRCFGSQ